MAAAARFHVVSVVRSAHVPVPVSREPADGAGPCAGSPHPRERGFTWRFMSADNRSVARSAYASSDVESCLEEIRIVRQNPALAVGETSRNGHGQWAWRVHPVAETAGTAPVQVMYR